jgi:hypothetical protein
MMSDEKEEGQGSDPATASWHIDRRIPVALIGTLGLQLIFGVWWLSSMEFRVEAHEKQLTRIESAMSENDRDSQGLDNRLTRLEEKLSSQTEILQEIKRILNGQGG